MIRRLDEDGNLAPVGMITGTYEYRHLEVCVPNIGLVGAVQKLFVTIKDGSIWEDHVQVASRTRDAFWYGNRKFLVCDEVVSARYGPTITVVSIRDESSRIPVFQEITITHRSSTSFVRSHPQAEIIHRAGEVSVVSPDGVSWAIFRKTDTTRVENRWVLGNLYVRNDLPEQIQTELIVSLAVMALR